MSDLPKPIVTHSMDSPDSKLIAAVSIGWPMVLSSLKSLLEPAKRWNWLAYQEIRSRPRNRSFAVAVAAC